MFFLNENNKTNDGQELSSEIQNNNVDIQNISDTITNEAVTKEYNSEDVEDCIIIVRNQKYNVQSFRQKHKGGDIFRCGEDMTNDFNRQHGDKQLKKLESYKL